MAASAPTSSLFQPWERQGSPWKQRPDQIRCAPGKLCTRQTERLGEGTVVPGGAFVTTDGAGTEANPAPYARPDEVIASLTDDNGNLVTKTAKIVGACTGAAAGSAPRGRQRG